MTDEMIARLATFFAIMDEKGEEAAIAYVEAITGEKIEDDADSEAPQLALVRTS